MEPPANNYSILLLELEAIKKACVLAKGNDIDRLNLRVEMSWQIQLLLADIRDQFQDFSEVGVSHSRRETNRAADFLVTEDDARYPANHQQIYGSSHRLKLPARNLQQIGNAYGYEDDDEDEDEDEEEEEEDEENGVQRFVEDAEEDDDEEEDDDDRDDYHRRIEAEEEPERHRKKRKLKNLASSYEFAPRVVTPSVAAATGPKPSFGGRNSPDHWIEDATFVLLDAWGDRFLQLGRKSLRSEEWHEVAEKVSQASKIGRTETQCRNRLDTLKKKYKKEKMKLAETDSTSSKWVYFKKMDMLMTSPPQQPGLSCALDSGEYDFMNPRIYLNRSNGLDGMRESPGNSESSEGDANRLPSKRTIFGEDADEGSSFRLLANSIQKFGEIYEKIENSKRQQMLELEKIRMEFHRDLEFQKRQILDRARVEITKIWQDDDEEIDDSAEYVSSSAVQKQAACSWHGSVWHCVRIKLVLYIKVLVEFALLGKERWGDHVRMYGDRGKH
ncbi:hypothetical protein HHK36_025683 [Tetracentron sinense]|uniref:Myb/SANT-like DNA-binding domain-containing protein n=1 Tax=Tetracentron sinense TaxID=13715 RepID=A0A835D396_TETSI|nr:hypothetical protein HHK36_025683 [Tetracentron sinense]